MKYQLLLFAALFVVTLPPPVSGSSNGSQEGSDALNDRPDVGNGAVLFEGCAACHGSHGGGTVDGQIPRIAGQHFSVLIKQLVDYRHAQRWDPRMEHFADQHHLKDAQAVSDVAAYASEIQTRPDGEVGVGSGEFVARGEEVYVRSCTSCHGASADGSEQGQIPRLAGQNYGYLVRQIHDAVEGRRPNFSASHIRLLKSLDFADITGVSDYLARIPRKADPISAQDLAGN